jgi:hypothetical protein
MFPFKHRGKKSDEVIIFEELLQGRIVRGNAKAEK